MLNQLTLWDTPSAISLPALEAGESPAVLPAGPTTGKSGRPRARANRSRSPAKAPELLMHGTYGPTFSASSVPEGPLQSWENRLRQRLARIGSTECELTWKASPTPAGVLLSRLVPSTPRTVEIDSGSLVPTDYWRTPQASVIEPRSSVVKFSGRAPKDPQVGLPDQVMATAALYPTPSASGFEAKSPEMLLARRARCKETTSAGNGFGLTLGQFACLESAMWKSPVASEARQGFQDRTKGKKGTQESLSTQVITATWPTPTAQNAKHASFSPAAQAKVANGEVTLCSAAFVHGTALDGSSATTGKRGVLNPAFPCWLMGYPLEHLSCGGTAMQSFRKLPRKSSQL